MIGVDERMIDLGDVELSAAEAGAGQRPLLLLHGFTGAKEDFTDWLDRLAHVGWHAVAPDLRGHGASSKPTSEDAYSFEILADDVERLAECLDWPRFALLGHSMGGMAAQVVAVRAPGRLDALVLMDTGHGAVEGLDPQLVDAAVGIVRTQGIDALAELLEGSESPLDSPPHQRLLDRRPGYAEFEQRKFRATSPALYAAMAQALVGTGDRLVGLRALPPSLPTLVMVGDQDRPFIGPSERMATAIPGASLAVIPDAGHSPQFESPDAWWEALSDFLGRLSSSGDALPPPSAR
jgi:pimeloyl-ACP methyl ester carboxylesterase